MANILNKADLFSAYENTKLETCVEYAERTGKGITYKDLPTRSDGGIPIASFRKNGELNSVFINETHSLIIGSTRSGKTTGFVIPMIMMKAMQKEKDSMFITDPKGELYSACAERLKEQGYKVILVNFRDYKHSENWNPLTPIYRKYHKAIDLEKSVKTSKDESGKILAEFNGKVYGAYGELREALEREKQYILNDVANDIDELCLSMITVESKRDPYWETSARQLLQAFIYALLEDSVPGTAGDRTLITEDTFSIRTIMSIYGTFTYSSDSSDGDHGFVADRGPDSLAKQYAVSTIISNGNATRMCILSSFNSKMAPYKEVVTNVITSCNSFELDELVGEEPVAVFVIYRDECKTSYEAVKQIITATYRKLIDVANAQPDLKLNRPFIFMLDEFGNLPAIPDFDVTISACGGRRIWFQIVLQSYSQLANNYGQDTAAIIRENLNMHIFFGTNNPETKRAFSEECGKKTILSPRGVFSGKDETFEGVGFEEVYVVPVSKLNYLEPGDCYVTIANFGSVLRSHMERYYLCDEYECKKADVSDYIPKVDVFDKKYLYEMKKKEPAPGSRRRFDFF